MTTLPQDLDLNADSWSAAVKAIPFLGYEKDFSKEIPGTLSVYVVTFVAITDKGMERKRYYIGQGNAQERANAHKSEYLRCKTTTRIGKSKLYREAFLGDVTSQYMQFEVKASGFTTATAKDMERQVATEMTELYGDDVITKPTKAREPKAPKPNKKLSSR